MTIDTGLIQAIIAFLTGGGLLLLISQGVKAVTAIRGGVRQSTRTVVRDLRDDRDEAEQRADYWQHCCEFWRNIAAGYGFQLRSHGFTPDPERPAPPRPPVWRPPSRDGDAELAADEV